LLPHTRKLNFFPKKFRSPQTTIFLLRALSNCFQDIWLCHNYRCLLDLKSKPSDFSVILQRKARSNVYDACKTLAADPNFLQRKFNSSKPSPLLCRIIFFRKPEVKIIGGTRFCVFPTIPEKCSACGGPKIYQPPSPPKKGYCLKRLTERFFLQIYTRINIF
jgi:hypothetical protein